MVSDEEILRRILSHKTFRTLREINKNVKIIYGGDNDTLQRTQSD